MCWFPIHFTFQSLKSVVLDGLSDVCVFCHTLFRESVLHRTHAKLLSQGKKRQGDHTTFTSLYCLLCIRCALQGNTSHSFPQQQKPQTQRMKLNMDSNGFDPLRTCSFKFRIWWKRPIQKS
eukprot:PhF_6_TR32399/c0_g1_i1/m.48071